MMATKKPSKQQIVGMRNAAPAVRQDRLPAAAQTVGRFATICLAHQWAKGCRCPALQHGLVVDSNCGQFCTAGEDDSFVAKRTLRQFAYTTSPNVELMPLLRAQREPFEEVHKHKALPQSPDGVAQCGLLIRSACARGGGRPNRPDAECVADEVQRGRVISAKRDLVSRRSPCFAMWVSVSRCDARQDECALAVCEAGQPVAE